jgi:threonine dehydrogenase-like Zn-dependent dehydrogenase
VLAQRLVFPDQGRCEVEEFDLDERLGPGEVLVRNRFSLINSDAELPAFTRTHRGFQESSSAYFRYPLCPGGAAVGEIITGTGELKPRTRVFHPGRHATFAKAKAAHCVVLPEGLEDQQAVFFGLAQAALAAPRVAPVRLGEQVLVVGAGLTGNVCAQIYQLSGAGLVAIADASPLRIAKARLCGLERCFALSQKPLVSWLADLGPRGAELVVEASGTPASLVEAVKAVVERGLVVLLGAPHGTPELDPYVVYAKGLAVIGAHPARLALAARRADEPLLMEWLATGRLWVEPLITHRLPFASAELGYLGLRDQSDEYLGVLLDYAP